MRPLNIPRPLLLLGPALLISTACDPWQLAPYLNGDPNSAPTELLRGAEPPSPGLKFAPAPVPQPTALHDNELELQSACEGLPPEEADVCRRRLGERQGPTSPGAQSLLPTDPIPEPIPVPVEP